MMDINNQIFSNSNSVLISVTNELKELIKTLNDDIIIKRIDKIINIMNNAIKENKKNNEKIIEIIQSMNKKLETLTNKCNIKIGVKNYPEGKYEGELVNNMREGKGKLYYIDNEKHKGKIYTGEWKNDLRNGKGVETWKSGNRFVGDFINDKREGYGIYYFSNGGIYDGNWKNGKKEGFGIEYYTDGDRYEGKWKNGKRNGQGVYFYKNGDREMGNYYNGDTIGKAVLIKVNNEVEIKNY